MKRYLILAEDSFNTRPRPCGYWMTWEELVDYTIERCTGDLTPGERETLRQKWMNRFSFTLPDF